MDNLTVLKKAAFFSDTRTNSSKISVENFVTTDSILQNKCGIKPSDVYPNGNLIAFEKGDILVGNIRPYLKKIWFADRKGGCSPDVLVFRTKQEFDSKFIYYSLFRDDFFNHMMKGSKGTKMPRGDKNQILDFLIPSFDLSNQQKIAAVLSALDSKIELNNLINAELEAMAKTLYDYWFVQFDFPDAHGKPYKTSGGKMLWNDELKREIPDGWEVGNLSSFGEIIGGSTPPKEVSEYFSTNGTAWITPKDLSLNGGNKFITKGELDVSDKGLKVASLNVMPKGTILLSSRAPVGYMAISRERVTTNQGFKSFVTKDVYPTEFVYYTIKNLIPAIKNNATGSTFKEVSSSTLKTIKVCLPNKDVIKNYTILVKDIFKRQDILEVENQKLAELRDWLLPMLMNGQVTVE